MKLTKFAKYAWGVLFYNVAVILWGAYVRATGSGAGCGKHWPTCQGAVIPRAAQIETLVEFSHRVTSGLAFLAVLGLFVWAWRAYPKKHIVRTGAALSMGFIILESLVGAGLVLFELVAYDDSLARVFSISVHLVNTFLMLASMALTAWWASGGKRLNWQNGGPARWAVLIGLLAIMVIGVTGAITALGDTILPMGSLAEELSQDFSASAHFLKRLRVWHPVIASLVGFYLLATAIFLNGPKHPERIKRGAKFLLVLFGVQLAAGLVNILLRAPVWMQMLHLLLADSVWITLVLLGALLMADETAIEPKPAVEAEVARAR